MCTLLLQIHKCAVDVILKKHKNVGHLLSAQHANQKAINRAYLAKILQNIIFLARQGLPMRGNWVDDDIFGGCERDSNFHQLLLLRAKDDPTILDIMKRKTNKYTDHHIQNELLKILANRHLRRIAKDINEAGYFALESDEVTDSSNKEQVIVCFRWVDSKFVPHEDFIGLHFVDDITATTIVRVLKDTVLRMNLKMSMCRAQCYDGASNMKKAAADIKRLESRALYLHCYGHSLNLAVSDTLKGIKPMSHALDNAQEICKLLKYSPRRDAIFHKLKDELSPQVPGIRTLCPTRWTVRAASLESIRLNYEILEATWEEAVDVVKESDIKARINGVAAKMKEFDFLFCLLLSERILKHTDNLSKTIQATAMPAVEGHRLSQLCIEVLRKLRTDECFDHFWAYVEQIRETLNVSDASLPRVHKRPRRYEDGTADHYHPPTPMMHYKQIYFEALDAAIVAIGDRFDQSDYSMYAKLEQLLLLAATQKDYSQILREVVNFYGSDFNASELQTHLELLSHMDIECARHELTFRDVHAHFTSLSSAQLSLMSQVVLLVKLVLLMPATIAVSERSASAMRRIKTYLRSTMTQSRLNNTMVLHIHNHLTDSIDHTSVLNEFASANDERRKLFGTFS